MTKSATNLPIQGKREENTGALQTWRPFKSLHREIDRLFQDFGRDFWRAPFRHSRFEVAPFNVASPAVDIVEKDHAYEITADLPGLDEKNVEVQLINDMLMVKGEKKEEKEEKKKGYYLQERHFGSFERSFRVPDDVESGKIEATFKKGVLTVMLPKKADAQKPAKKIDIKAA